MKDTKQIRDAIKTPVRYDVKQKVIRHGEFGDVLCVIPTPMIFGGEENAEAVFVELDVIGNQIADALNRPIEFCDNVTANREAYEQGKKDANAGLEAKCVECQQPLQGDVVFYRTDFIVCKPCHDTAERNWELDKADLIAAGHKIPCDKMNALSAITDGKESDDGK